jgi:hypothetical protein
MMCFPGRPLAAFPTFIAVGAILLLTGAALGGDDRAPSPFHFPTVPREHTHVRLLLENALGYAAPAHHLTDPVSGYPVEGWNQDPKAGLYLRSFTQLTAIGQWLELLANIVAGYADTPYLSRDQALDKLSHLVRSLRADQHDPTLSAEGLLSNFLDLASGKRLGPLASDVDKRKFVATFGADKGERIWNALIAKGWITPRKVPGEAEIHRIAQYGYDYFDGPLAPFADEVTRQKVLAILDQRVVMAVFGDNANLSASVAKAIGALLHPSVRGLRGVETPRRELERFLEDQQAGYTRLYDAKAGLFNFGWDATRDRLFGWEDLEGKWTTGHIDYFVNEFRAPATFVVLRFGLPIEAIGNLGFKIKTYGMQDGTSRYALAPWEGSAFQAMGLGLWLGEADRPGWRALLDNVVAIEVDYASRHKLPGFLSESYTGNGTQYTGSVGIPDLTVVPRPRIIDAASLYTLGVAYTIAPERVETFLAANWALVSRTFSDHGPWEGYNISRREVIPFQTTAHTLALVLGLLRTGSEHMARYLDSRGQAARLAAVFPSAEPAPLDLLSGATDALAWTDKESRHQSRREQTAFHVQSDGVHFLGIALVAQGPHGLNLSGSRLRVRYRSTEAIEPVTIALKPVSNPQAVGLIAKEIFTRFAATPQQEAEIEVALPAMPGLTQVKEVVFSHERGARGQAIDLTITRVECLPQQ